MYASIFPCFVCLENALGDVEIALPATELPAVQRGRDGTAAFGP